MKLILIFSSNSFSQFCILQIRKTSLFFSFLLECLSFECFQFVHSLEKSSRGFGVSPWNVPGAWVRHKHSLRTLLGTPPTSGISSPPPVCRPLGSLCLLCRAHCHPHGGETDENSQLGWRQDWLGALLNLSWNACTQGAGSLPVWNKKSSDQAGCICLDPSRVGSAQSQAQGSPWMKSFRQAPKTCPQWARL